MDSYFDVIIIGSGMSGLYSALKIKKLCCLICLETVADKSNHHREQGQEDDSKYHQREIMFYDRYVAKDETNACE